MDYATLISTVDNICENTFTAADHIMFTQQAEQKIYNTVQFPALRKTCVGMLTSANRYLTLPTDYLFSYSIAVIDGTGAYNHLLFKDNNFLREAYPNPTATGKPKHYCIFDELSLEVGPTPDSNYSVEINYGSYPVSIVTAGNTWLGDTFDSALLNGALIEAIRFMKGEEDLVAVYDKLYMQSIALLKGLSDGKLRTDAYRTGQISNPLT